MPETFIATLRKGIAKAVSAHANGILLNFCPPEYARDLVGSLDKTSSRRPIASCYLKIFYSRSDDTAKRMLIQEFANYNRIPAYHQMFEAIGVADEIAAASSGLTSGRDVQVSKELLHIFLCNPARKELSAYVGAFRDAGVDLPCLYPYFESGEDEAFKISRVEEIVQTRFIGHGSSMRVASASAGQCGENELYQLPRRFRT